MRSVLMAVVVVWWCPLMLLPVLLGQQAQDTWHTDRQGAMDRYDVFYPSRASRSASESGQQQHGHQQQQQQEHARSRHARAAPDFPDNEEVVYHINAPLFFKDSLHLRLSPASEFIAPGFVIQRVSGNYTWLEEIQQGTLDCFYSGFVLGHDDSVVSLATCDGMVFEHKDVYADVKHRNYLCQVSTEDECESMVGKACASESQAYGTMVTDYTLDTALSERKMNTKECKTYTTYLECLRSAVGKCSNQTSGVKALKTKSADYSEKGCGTFDTTIKDSSAADGLSFSMFLALLVLSVRTNFRFED